MLLFVDDTIRNASQSSFQLVMEDHTIQNIFLGRFFSEHTVDHLEGIFVVISEGLSRGFSNQQGSSKFRLNKPGSQTDTGTSHVEAEEKQGGCSGQSSNFTPIGDKPSETFSNNGETHTQGFFIGLTSLSFLDLDLFFDNIHIISLILSLSTNFLLNLSHLRIVSQFLFILNGFSSHAFLSLQRFFISLSSLLGHHLLMFQHFSLSLSFQII
mmetsp:Transcript_43194/g.49663  ORF Transcript_43194/g.49663 Transcript_43194/m.49663 type:complete len:212 (+) Transcript_43194:1067-1702(+)